MKLPTLPMAKNILVKNCSTSLSSPKKTRKRKREPYVINLGNNIAEEVNIDIYTSNYTIDDDRDLFKNLDSYYKGINRNGTNLRNS